MDPEDEEKIPFIDEILADSLEKRNGQTLLEMEIGTDITPSAPQVHSHAEDHCNNLYPSLQSLINDSSTSPPPNPPIDDNACPESIVPGWKVDRGKSFKMVEGILQEEKRNSFKYPIHTAAEKGRLKTLKRLLQKGDPVLLDFKKRTPLHYACGFAYQKKAIEMMEAILACPLAQDQPDDPQRKQHLIDAQDNKGETALHIAAKTGHRDLAEKLIWSAADVNVRDNNGIEPLEVIYSKCPAALNEVFNSAVMCKVGDPMDQNLTVNFDFGSIVGYPTPEDDLTTFKLETKLLSYSLQQSEQKRAAIILHPIVQVFLFLKWKKIRILLWISILYHVMWLLLYTLFITDLYLIKCPYQNEEGSEEEDSQNFPENSTLDVLPDNMNDATPLNQTGGGLTIENYLFVYPDINGTVKFCKVEMGLLSSLTLELSWIFFLSLTVALKEMYEIYSTPHPKFYFMQLENIGQWLLIAIIGLTSIPIFTKNIYPWQYQLAALGIFLTWSLILSQIGKIPQFTIYIEILGKVLRSFTMFMITFASLLVAFTVAFQILMPQKVGFENFPFGFIKVLVMMTGEIEYNDVFYGEDTPAEIPFPTSTKLLYAAFVSVVTMILFNLLIGLTVSDIQGLQHVARLSSSSSQVEQIYLMERFILSKRIQFFLKRIKRNHWMRFFLVTQQTEDLTTNMGVDIHISKLPKGFQHEVREVAAPNYVQDKDDDEEEAGSNEEESKEIPAEEAPQSPRGSSDKIDTTSISKRELKEQIKDILKELLHEIKSEKCQSDS